MKKILEALNIRNLNSQNNKNNQSGKKYRKKRDVINGEVIPGTLFDLYSQALPNSRNMFKENK